jgi:hypothetical protein
MTETSYQRHIRNDGKGNRTVFYCSMTDEERKEYWQDYHAEQERLANRTKEEKANDFQKAVAKIAEETKAASIQKAQERERRFKGSYCEKEMRKHWAQLERSYGRKD